MGVTTKMICTSNKKYLITMNNILRRNMTWTHIKQKNIMELTFAKIMIMICITLNFDHAYSSNQIRGITLNFADRTRKFKELLGNLFIMNLKNGQLILFSNKRTFYFYKINILKYHLYLSLLNNTYY